MVFIKPFKVVRLVSDLLIAASDTTSITATWVLYILSQHQHIQVVHIADGKTILFPPQEGVRKELPKDNSIVTSQQVEQNPNRMPYALG